jgi:hypothetical protein
MRVWVFQALLVFQLAGAVALTIPAILSPDVRGLPPLAIVFGLIRPIVGIPLVVALLLALQRLGPKPTIAAPALASLWWLLSVIAHIALGVPNGPVVLRSLKFGDAPSTPPWVTALVLFAVLLWFVVSTWSHRETQAYLARETPLKR